jgi:hypothetical protein
MAATGKGRAGVSWWDRVLGMFGGRREREPEVVLPHVPTGPELLAALDAIGPQIRGKVPGMVQSRSDRIVETLRDTIPRLDQLGGGNRNVHSVKAAVTSYLPEILGGYLRLPRSYADHSPARGGKTVLMDTVDQLDLLSRELDKIFEAACQEDADAVIAHGRFLAEKFGDSSLDLDPASGAGPLPGPDGSGPVPGPGGPR